MLHPGSLLLHSLFTFLVAIIPAGAVPAPASTANQFQLGSNSENDWQKYVRSPSTQIIHPTSIVANYTQGNVTNPDGLLTGHGKTILTRSNNSASIPTIVVDFGQNIAGYLSIKFGGAYNSTEGLPGIRLAFSESLQYGYLTDVSDFSRSDNVVSPRRCIKSCLLIFISGRHNYTGKRPGKERVRSILLRKPADHVTVSDRGEPKPLHLD